MHMNADHPLSVFVNGRPRPTIMDDMRRRIHRGDIDAERREAIQVRSIPLPLPLPSPAASVWTG